MDAVWKAAQATSAIDLVRERAEKDLVLGMDIALAGGPSEMKDALAAGLACCHRGCSPAWRYRSTRGNLLRPTNRRSAVVIPRTKPESFSTLFCLSPTCLLACLAGGWLAGWLAAG